MKTPGGVQILLEFSYLFFHLRFRAVLNRHGGPDRPFCLHLAGRHGITRGTTIYFFDPSGNRLEAFGGYTAYQMDPDCRAIKWTTDQIGPAVFYYSQELNETFLSVYT